MKNIAGLDVRHLPETETVLFEQSLLSREPSLFIYRLEISYTEAGERKKEPLLCALEPDGVNSLPILTSEESYRINSKRMKELSA